MQKYILPSGHRTSDEAKYYKAWNNVGKYFAKISGLKFREVSGNDLIMEEVFKRSNGKIGVSRIISAPKSVACRVINYTYGLNHQIADLKKTVSALASEFEQRMTPTPEAQ